MSGAEAIAEEFGKLRIEFERHSRDRIAAMQELVASLEREPGNNALTGRLRTHFHAFAGLGTTYGYPEATLLGERGESRTAVLVESGAPATREDVRGLQELVEALRQCFPVSA